MSKSVIPKTLLHLKLSSVKVWCHMRVMFKLLKSGMSYFSGPSQFFDTDTRLCGLPSILVQTVLALRLGGLLLNLGLLALRSKSGISSSHYMLLDRVLSIVFFLWCILSFRSLRSYLECNFYSCTAQEIPFFWIHFEVLLLKVLIVYKCMLPTHKFIRYFKDWLWL